MKPQSESEPETATDEASHDDAASVVDEALAAEAKTASRDEEIDRLRGELEVANKHVLSAQAELENFRKRMRRDMEEQLKFAALPLVADVLHVRDNLVRAIEAAKTSDSGSTGSLLDGVSLLVKQFDDTLGKHGITAIAAMGETFDPNFHQAISQMPSADCPAGSIAFEAATGFQMHGRVIRPSQVIVSTGPA